MILSVTLNPAWDITHEVDRLEAGSTHRVSSVQVRPGGKGVNVSRVLQGLGHRTLATGLVAGPSGRELAVALAKDGVPEAFFASAVSATRRTVSVVEAVSGRATVLTEPGPAIGSVHWPSLRGHLAELIGGSDLVVLSGSLPPAVPPDAYGQLAAIARAAGIPAIVDADGEALGYSLSAAPDLVKPNLDELEAATGLRDPRAGGRVLLAAGAQRVVVSAGAAGLTGVDALGAWRATPAPLMPANPTGAGDAAVAALAVGLLQGLEWPDLLRLACSWSAAAVLEPLAGVVDASTAERLLGTVTVTRLEQHRSQVSDVAEVSGSGRCGI